MAEIALGVDVGGTYAKVAAVSPSGRVLRLGEFPTQGSLGPAAFVRRVGEVLDSWRRDSAHGPQRTSLWGPGPSPSGGSALHFVAAGLGLAGDVDSARGRLRFAPNLRGWEGYDFKTAFARRLGLRAIIDNDANMAVWGGYVMELKKRPANVVGLTLGTGVGGGLILGGRLYRGATGSAGEIGHARVEIPGEPCHCGARGCLEAYAGSYGIVRTARKLLMESSRQSLLRAWKNLEPSHIALAARRGDVLAREVWARTGRHLAVGLSNLVMILNPDVVLLLGGVSRAGRWLLGPVRSYLRKQPFRTPFRRLSLRAADNHNWGCVGAALLALEKSARP